MAIIIFVGSLNEYLLLLSNSTAKERKRIVNIDGGLATTRASIDGIIHFIDALHVFFWQSKKGEVYKAWESNNIEKKIFQDQTKKYFFAGFKCMYHIMRYKI